MALVLVDPSPNIVRTAAGLGAELVLLTPPGANVLRLMNDAVRAIYTVDLDDCRQLTTLAEAVLRSENPQAVVSVTERGLLAAAILSELFGTPSTPVNVVQNIYDKLRMRRLLAERAPELTVDHGLASSPNVPDLLFSGHSRVVAKPVTGTASSGVRLLTSITQVHQLDNPANYLLETYVDGPEFDVESFSVSGNHQIIAIGLQEKSTLNPFVEVSHYIPSPGLTSAQTERIEAAVKRLLEALDLRDGPAHTEVKLSGDEVKVIETHNRPGGDGIAGLVQMVYGIEWRAVCVGWPLGLRPTPAPADHSAAAITFFTAQPGTVVELVEPSLTNGSATLQRWGFDTCIGSVVDELGSSKDRVGWAVVSAPTPEECQQAVHDLQAVQHVVTE